MTRLRQRAFLAALAAVASIGVTGQGAAFEIFGLRLWGSPQEEAVEVIDPLPFTVTFAVQGGSDNLARALEASSGLWTGRETPASGRAGLLARARGDYRRILATLYNNAYYGGEISILLAGREAADLALDAALPAVVPVEIAVRTGPRFRFGEAAIVNPPPPPAGPGDLVEDPIGDGFRPGARAGAGVVAAASGTAIERWRQASHAKAREVERVIVADHATTLLDARIVLDPGRAARFGRVEVSGSRRVDPGFVAYMAGIPQGAAFDPDRIRLAEERLSRLGVFRSIRIEEAEEIAPDGALDMAILVEDRAPRTIGGGATVSTLDGLGLQAFWRHRNLFGRAERLRFDASLSGLGLSGGVDQLTYSGEVGFQRPGVINPNTDFIASLRARQLDLDTYRERSVTGRFGLQRSFARNLNGELAFEATWARFDDFFGARDFLMLGPVARGDYDRRDDALEPTRGYFLAAEVRPFYEAEFGNLAVRGTLEGRIYRGLGAEDRLVLAARARIGAYDGPREAESPPDQLFFAGGAGSVRGYAFRSIGVETTNAEGETGIVGGRSLAEASGEARFRINDRFGAVGFLDAGYVAASSTFDGGADSDLRLGAGAGLRYYTALGPLRLDVAAPVNARREDSSVAVYIGIGQAF